MAFDEKGQASTATRRCASARAPTGCSPSGSASRPRTSSSTRTSSPSPPASRSTTTTPSISSRRRGSSRRTLPGAKVSGGVSQRLVLVPRQQPRARGDARGLPLPRDRGRPRHGDRQRRHARRLRGDPEGPARAGRGCAAQPAARRHRAPGRLRRRAQGPPGRRRPRTEAQARTCAWRSAARRGAPDARAGQGHRRLRRGGHRGGAPDTAKYPAPARHHRGAADGRHARRRRPVRRGQDVPAPGGQVRPRDEEGRRLPDAVHGGGEAPARRRRRHSARRRAASSWPRSRATSTTSARTSSASSSPATTTRSSTSASWCRARRSSPRPGETQADVIGLSGLITPSLDEMVHVAKEMKRARASPCRCSSAAPPPARRTPPSRSRPSTRPGVVHVLDASRVVNVVSSLLSPDRQGRLPRRGRAPSRRSQREEFAGAPRAQAACCPLAAARARRTPVDWAAVDIPRPEFLGARGVRPRAAGRDRPLHRLGPVLQRLGASRAAFPTSSRIPWSARRPPSSTTTRRSCWPASSAEKRFTAKAVIGFWPCQRRGRRHRGLRGRSRARGSSRPSTCCASSWRSPPDQPNHCLADFLAPRDRGRLDYLGGFAVTAGHGVEEFARRVRSRPRRLLRHHGQGAGRPPGRGDGRIVPQEGPRWRAGSGARRT